MNIENNDNNNNNHNHDHNGDNNNDNNDAQENKQPTKCMNDQVLVVLPWSLRRMYFAHSNAYPDEFR